MPVGIGAGAAAQAQQQQQQQQQQHAAGAAAAAAGGGGAQAAVPAVPEASPFPDNHKAARTRVEVKPYSGQKTNKAFDLWEENTLAIPKARGQPFMFSVWPYHRIGSAELPFPQGYTAGDPVPINMEGHPLNGQNLAGDQIEEYNKNVKATIDQDRAFAAEITTKLTGQARDWLISLPAGTKDSARSLMAALKRRFHVTAANQSSYVSQTGMKIMNLKNAVGDFKSIEHFNDSVRIIISDAKKCQLGLQDDFLKLVYLKALPAGWNSFRLKMSGIDGKISLHDGTLRTKTLEEVMESACDHAAQGLVKQDGDERTHEAAFFTKQKGKRGADAISSGEYATEMSQLLCTNPKCGRVGHIAAICCQKGGGLAGTTKEFRDTFFSSTRAYTRTGEKKGQRGGYNKKGAKPADRRTERAFQAKIGELEDKIGHQKQEIGRLLKKRDAHAPEKREQEPRFDKFTGERLFIASEHQLTEVMPQPIRETAMRATTGTAGNNKEMTIWIDSMASSNFVAAGSGLVDTKEVEYPVQLADGSNIPVTTEGKLKARLVAQGGIHGAGANPMLTIPCKTGPNFAHNLMSVKYWIDRGAAVHFESGNCYIEEARNKKPKHSHIPFEDRDEGFALRLKLTKKTMNAMRAVTLKQSSGPGTNMSSSTPAVTTEHAEKQASAHPESDD